MMGVVRCSKPVAAWVATLCVIVGWVSLVVHAQEPESGPRARVVEPAIDLGSVFVGSPAEVEFVVANDGGEVLRILEASTGCDCLLAEFDKTVAPGQTGRVRASLLTDQLRGVVAKSVLLRTNDPRQPRITLTIRAHVDSAIALLPMSTMYLRERDGQPPVGRILIRAEDADVAALAPSDVRPSEPWLTASVVRLERPRERGLGLPAARPGDWLLEVRFRDDEVRFGRQAGTVAFRTGVARQPSAEVVVESNIPAPLELSTRRLVLAPRGARAGTAGCCSPRCAPDSTRRRSASRPTRRASRCRSSRRPSACSRSTSCGRATSSSRVRSSSVWVTRRFESPSREPAAERPRSAGRAGHAQVGPARVLRLR